MNTKEYQWISETLQNLKRYSDGCGFAGLSNDLKMTIIHFEYEYAEHKMAANEKGSSLIGDLEKGPVQKH